MKSLGSKSPGILTRLGALAKGQNTVQVQSGRTAASWVRGGFPLGGRSGILRGSSSWVTMGNPAAHEFGHLLGLEDQYTSFGAKPGWSGNIMAEPAGQGTVNNANLEQVLGSGERTIRVMGDFK